jgi:hypothetical protein
MQEGKPSPPITHPRRGTAYIVCLLLRCKVNQHRKVSLIGPAQDEPMRILLVLSCFLMGWHGIRVHEAWAQPADCAAPASSGPSLPLAVDIGGRPGIPPGLGGEAYLAIPLASSGYSCPPPALPRDILHGEPGEVLGGEPGEVLGGQPSADLLHGPGRPRVRITPP